MRGPWCRSARECRRVRPGHRIAGRIHGNAAVSFGIHRQLPMPDHLSFAPWRIGGPARRFFAISSPGGHTPGMNSAQAGRRPSRRQAGHPSECESIQGRDSTVKSGMPSQRSRDAQMVPLTRRRRQPPRSGRGGLSAPPRRRPSPRPPGALRVGHRRPSCG